MTKLIRNEQVFNDELDHPFPSHNLPQKNSTSITGSSGGAGGSTLDRKRRLFGRLPNKVSGSSRGRKLRDNAIIFSTKFTLSLSQFGSGTSSNTAASFLVSIKSSLTGATGALLLIIATGNDRQRKEVFRRTTSSSAASVLIRTALICWKLSESLLASAA
uniref:Uncharacterized protein n=1 Tax=Romanomermis culicivorax TaxID=13658 RepID=A0A915KTS3_ROMCU